MRLIPIIFISLISVASLANESVVRSDVRKIYKTLKKQYQKELDQRNINLTLNIKSKKSQNAGVRQNPYKPRKKHLIVYTGLIKEDCQDFDSLVLIMCHEFGHLLGEKRIHNHKIGVMVSPEGESDYWATLECTPGYFEQNTIELEARVFDHEVYELCAHEKKTSEYQVCLRTLQAGLNLGRCVSRDKKVVSYKTPDNSEIQQTWDRYPEKQCRLDTYLAGYLKEPRPRCWYNPKDF